MINFKYDVVIVGAGAAGLMCAIEAGKRGRKVLLLDHAKSVGEKIRISGGGRCNFTNIHASPANYLSNNPHFCISALKRYTQFDFIKLVEKHNIAYHEKTLGQLFCDNSAKQIIGMLIDECESANVEIRLDTKVTDIVKNAQFAVSLRQNKEDCSIETSSLVIATGGPSIPKMGSTGFGYDIAKKFNLNVIKPSAALVPFLLKSNMLTRLAGVSLDAIVTCGDTSFREALLFTHRGLSGPVILQISSYWREGNIVQVNLAPDIDVFTRLKDVRDAKSKQEIHKILATILPKRLAQYICDESGCSGYIADLSNKKLQQIANSINQWQFIPDDTEGFRTAEVTLGGVDSNELSSKTFESKKVADLYFIGEVVDVTGHLGGFNFQWAWSSGHAAGQYV